MLNLPMQFGCCSVIVTKDALKPEIILMLVIFGIEPSHCLRVDNNNNKQPIPKGWPIRNTWSKLDRPALASSTLCTAQVIPVTNKY